MSSTVASNNGSTQPKDSEDSLVNNSPHNASMTNVEENVDSAKLEPCKNVAPKGPFEDRFTNLASATNGARVFFATDDWFAAAENLLQDGPPIFDVDAYCEQGKVLDGWETRRRRQAGHDWCLIQLSSRAQIEALELDTAHFTGNNAPKVSLEIIDLNAAELSNLVGKLPLAYERLLHGGVQGTGRLPGEVQQALDAVTAYGGQWKALLPITPLNPGYEPTRMHYFQLNEPVIGNIVRLNYFPDGGVARLRCWGKGLGEVKPPTLPLYMPMKTCDQCTVVAHSTTDQTPSCLPYDYPELSSADEGGEGRSCSNKHYGEPWHLIQKHLGINMGDGWETARHPNRPSILVLKKGSTLLDIPLSDWAVLKLGKEASNGVARVIIDTKHFRGNFPESAMLEGCYDPEESNKAEWFTLIPRTRMSPDAEHVFERSKNQMENADKIITHVRVSIYPDGGISRVRIYG
ncbi:allantoicase [Nitzschia inconspicua]|uniref:Allantoicase n=1 Tax=Nitzschia inconspicua TaxID=303405 RepID=A0A9K3PNA7_9STRA|nr:allantoicase [Nitzschia inconspicua]